MIAGIMLIITYGKNVRGTSLLPLTLDYLVLNIGAQIYVNWAWSDGIITTRERIIMGVFSFSNGLMILVNLALFIWGCVVVFSVLTKWTKKDRDSEFFCETTPFMTALVLVIIKLVSPVKTTIRSSN